MLMMQQTELLQMFGNRCEIGAQFEHQNAIKQTSCRPYDSKEKALKPRCFKAFGVAERVQLNPNLNPTFQGRQK